MKIPITINRGCKNARIPKFKECRNILFLNRLLLVSLMSLTTSAKDKIIPEAAIDSYPSDNELRPNVGLSEIKKNTIMEKTFNLVVKSDLLK